MNGAAIQIASREFDNDFFKLADATRKHLQGKIDAMGMRLPDFPHYRMTGSDQFRLRVGDYRIIYRFDLARGEIYLLAMGHRREVYRH